MTSTRMESLNRRLRIIAGIKAGLRYSLIAQHERVVEQYVSAIAIQNGLRRQVKHGRRVRTQIELPYLTPSEATWKRISDNLDAYNRRVGRI